MPYPNFRAGQRVTAALLNAGKLEFVTNAAGTQTNTTTTMVNATDLVFPVVANARYKVHALISFDAATSAPAAGDAKFDWEVPSGATMQRNIITPAASNTNTTDTNAQFIRRGSATDQTAGGNNGAGSAFVVHEEIIDLVTGSTAGDVQFRFALQTGTGTATLNADSIVYYQQVA